MFFFSVKNSRKDGTSSSLKHPRHSTIEVSVTEFSFVFCKHVFNKNYPTVDGNYQNLGIAAIRVVAGVKKPFMSQICCASACRYVTGK